MQIIIHVVPRNILSVVIADGRAFLTCQVAFMLPQCNVEVITATFKYSNSPYASQSWWEVFLPISPICCRFSWNPWNLCMV